MTTKWIIIKSNRMLFARHQMQAKIATIKADSPNFSSSTVTFHGSDFYHRKHHWKLVVDPKLLHLPDPHFSFLSIDQLCPGCLGFDWLKYWIVFQAWGSRGTRPRFPRCRETTTSSDVARCIPSPRTFPTRRWGTPPSWGNPRHVMSCLSFVAALSWSQAGLLQSLDRVAASWRKVAITQGEESHTLAPAIHPSSPRVTPTCLNVSTETAWLSPQFGICGKWRPYGVVVVIFFTRPLVIVPIISRLLPNSCSDRCDLNTSPALFYPSSLVLNGRNTILVENCKLDRYQITEEANVLSTCTPSPVLFLSFRVVNFRFLFPFESPL